MFGGQQGTDPVEANGDIGKGEKVRKRAKGLGGKDE